MDLKDLGIGEDLTAASAEQLDWALITLGNERDKLIELQAQVKAEHDRRDTRERRALALSMLSQADRDELLDGWGMEPGERADLSARGNEIASLRAALPAAEDKPEAQTIEAGEGPDTSEVGSLGQ